MYECKGVPHLVLIDAKSGDVITLEGTNVIMAGVEAFPFTPEAVSAAKKKQWEAAIDAEKTRCASLLVELKDWSALGSDVASLQAHEAVAIFMGNFENEASVVAGPLIQASNSLGSRLKVFFLPYLVTDQAAQAEFEATFPSSWTVLPQSTATELAKVPFHEVSPMRL